MLQMNLLGELEVIIDGKPLNYQSQRGLALLVLLILSKNETMSRQELIRYLWQESDQPRNGNLRVLLNRLKCLVGEQHLIITNDKLKLSNAFSDINQFTRLKAQRTPQAYQEAIKLYRNHFLINLDLRAANPEWEAWLTCEQKFWDNQIVEVFRELICFLYTHGQRRSDLDDALYYSYKLVELEPWDDEAHIQIGRIYLKKRQPEAARAHINNYLSRLKREGLLEPLSKITTFQKHLSLGEPPLVDRRSNCFELV